MNERCGDDRSKNSAQRTANSNESEKAFALFGREQIGHERPENRGGEKVEHAYPNEKGDIDPPLLSRRHEAHEDEKDDEIKNEETVGDRDEPAPWHAGHDRREERVRDNHGEQNDREHPPQVFEVARADVVANRADNVIPGEDDEEEHKAEPERADFVRLNVDDFGKELFQYEIAGRLCETAIVLNGV